MKKIHLFVLSAFLATSMYAKDSGVVSSVSLVGMSMDYREYNDGGTLLDSEKSSFTDLAGVEMNLGYIFSKDSSAYNQMRVNLMVLGGETDYKGSYLGSNALYGSVVSTTQNSVIDMDISYKRTNSLANNFELNYGLGLGYRFWERSLSASQVERYTWYSLRPMVGTTYEVSNKLNIGLALEYQYGMRPTMSASDPSLDFTLGSADIIEVSLPINYQFNERFNMFFEYVYQKQTITKSDVQYDGVTGYYEPDSTANNQYLKLGMGFKF